MQYAYWDRIYIVSNICTIRTYYSELDNPITWEEFKAVVNGIKNDKSPGANGVTAEAFKAMNATNLQEVYQLIKAFWDGTRDFAAPSRWDTSPKGLKPR